MFMFHVMHCISPPSYTIASLVDTNHVSTSWYQHIFSAHRLTTNSPRATQWWDGRYAFDNCYIKCSMCFLNIIIIIIILYYVFYVCFSICSANMWLGTQHTHTHTYTHANTRGLRSFCFWMDGAVTLTTAQQRHNSNCSRCLAHHISPRKTRTPPCN